MPKSRWENSLEYYDPIKLAEEKIEKQLDRNQEGFVKTPDKGKAIFLDQEKYMDMLSGHIWRESLLLQLFEKEGIDGVPKVKESVGGYIQLGKDEDYAYRYNLLKLERLDKLLDKDILHQEEAVLVILNVAEILDEVLTKTKKTPYGYKSGKYNEK